jgi:uncharacterized membrane protein YqjE
MVFMPIPKSRLNEVDLAIVGIFELIFIGLAVWAVQIGDHSRFIAVIAGMIVILIPVAIEMLVKITLPFGVKSLISLSLFLHISGGVMRWYWSPVFPLFDKVAHFVSGMAVGMVVLVFFIFLDRWGIRFKRSTVLISIVLIVAILGGIWKIGEVYFDITAHTTFDDGLPDLIGDDVAHTIGSIAAVLVSYLYIRSIPGGESLNYLFRRK